MTREEKLKRILEMMEELLGYCEDEEEINKTYASIKFTLETYKELYGENARQ